MIEAGVVMRDLTLENPIRAIREISHDTTGRRTVRLANGRQLSALDLQREYYAKAVEFVAREGSTDPLHERVLDLWDRTLTAVETADLSLVGHRDRLGHQVPAHRRTTPPSTGSTSTTRGWPRSTSPTTTSTAAAGCSTCSSGAGWSPGSSPTRRSSQAKVRPPETTRAKLRGDFIRAAQEHRRDFTVDWVHLKLNDQAQRTVLCKDPFLAQDPRVERLIEGMSA